MIRTNDTATAAELRELFSMDDPEDVLEKTIETHDGDWIYDNDLSKWRFWKHKGVDD